MTRPDETEDQAVTMTCPNETEDQAVTMTHSDEADVKMTRPDETGDQAVAMTRSDEIENAAILSQTRPNQTEGFVMISTDNNAAVIGHIESADTTLNKQGAQASEESGPADWSQKDIHAAYS